MPDRTERPARAALCVLILLQVTMLMALFFKLPPHPPETIPLGGMAPVLGMALSAALTALILGVETKAGAVFCGFAALMAAVSFGPQKYVDPAFALVWPAVISAQIAMLTLLAHLARTLIPAKLAAA